VVTGQGYHRAELALVHVLLLLLLLVHLAECRHQQLRSQRQLLLLLLLLLLQGSGCCRGVLLRAYACRYLQLHLLLLLALPRLLLLCHAV
jgi:hypothetical protein